MKKIARHFCFKEGILEAIQKKKKGLYRHNPSQSYRIGHFKAVYTKGLHWAVIDQNLSTIWLSGSGRPLLCMHCLSENHLAAHYPHTWDNLLSSLAPQWVASSPAPTSQWVMSPYRHDVAQPNPQRSLQLPAYVANLLGRPGPSHNQWQPITCGLYNASEGSRCNYDPCKFAHRCRTCGGPHPASKCRLSQH